MAKSKKVVEAEAVEATNQKTAKKKRRTKAEIEAANLETSSKVVQVETQKPTSKEKQEDSFREGKGQNQAPTFKVYLGGNEYWWTKSQVDIGLQRGLDIHIPEGSPYSPPVGVRCKSCGK